MDLDSLLGLPDFAEENNPDLPYGLAGTLHIGVCGEHLRAAAAEPIQWTGRTSLLLARAAKFGADLRTFCLHGSVDFLLGRPDSGVEVELKIETDATGTRLLFSRELSNSKKTSLEIWERGELRQKMTLPVVPNRSLAEIRLGVSTAVRFGDAPTGLEILVSQDEFSLMEWKNALLFNLLDGNIRQAWRVLDQEIFPMKEEALDWRRLESFLASALRVTKSVHFGLAPIPLCRGGTMEPRMGSSELYRSVLRGIEICWPSAASEESELPKELHDLIEVCQTGKTSDEIRAKAAVFAGSSGHDPRIAAGWAALLGWMHLGDSRFEEALRSFSAVQPTEGDPFALEAGKALAKHLQLMSTLPADRLNLETNDAVWSRILPPSLG